MKRALLTMMAVLLCIAITVPVGSVSSDLWWRTEEYYGAGIDCSGVPFWAVNTVLGTKTYNAKSPIPEGAHGQYKNFYQKDLKITETKGVFNYDKLEPGDLIFIDTEDKGKLGYKDKDGEDGKVDHVLLYLGDGEVCHANRKDNKVVIEKLDSALRRGVRGGKTYFDCLAGCGRLEELTKDQRKKVVELAKSLKGASYQLGGKGYDVKDEVFVTAETIIEGGYVWNWKYNDELKRKIIKEELNKENENEDLGGVDFSSIQLNYISVSSDQNGGTFSYVLKAKKAEEGDKIIDIEDATELSLNAFFIGLTLPDSKFWVNLDPSEPDRIMDEDLRNTDVGRIMLEADLQMKKDLCSYKNPCESKIGEELVGLLEKKKGGELTKECMRKHPNEIEDDDNVIFFSNIRNWIVPGKTDTYGTDNEVYIVDIALNIESEPVYEDSTYQIERYLFSMDAKLEDDLNESIITENLKDIFKTKGFPLYGNTTITKERENKWVITDEEKFIIKKEDGKLNIYQNPFVSDECKEDLNEASKEYCRYNTELQEAMLLPLLVQEVNHGENYSDLRQVYTSLALAQWYKDKNGYTSGIFIDSKDLAGLESKYTWSAEDVWRDYVRSFEEGEYHCSKNIIYEERGHIFYGSYYYSSGGIIFMDIILTNIGDMPSALRELTSETVYTTFTNEGDDYYFGDGLYVSSSTPTTTTSMPTQPGFEAVFAITGLLAVAYHLKRRK